MKFRSTSTQRPLRRYKRKQNLCLSAKWKNLRAMREEERGQNRDIFQSKFIIACIGTKSKSNSKYCMNSTTTKAWFPVHLFPGNLSSPATQLRTPYDCTSPVIKPVPTVSPVTHVPWHYLHNTPLLLTTALARGSISSHWFLVKKVLTGQPAFACWLTSDRLNRTDHCWAHHAASPFLGALLGVSFLLLFLFIWFSQNLLEFDQRVFCLSA